MWRMLSRSWVFYSWIFFCYCNHYTSIVWDIKWKVPIQLLCGCCNVLRCRADLADTILQEIKCHVFRKKSTKACIIKYKLQYNW
jgi:hypothetical protein